MSFLTIESAAADLGLSAASLRESAKAGKIPGARRVGGRWRIHKATFEEYFRSAQPSERPAA